MTQMYTKEQLFMAIELAQIIQYYDLDVGSVTFEYSPEQIIEKITPPPPVVELEDLSECFNDKFPLNAKNLELVFKDWLLDEIRDDTEHGREGVDSLTKRCIVNGITYIVSISDVRWDRLDKQYYFIDTYHSPTVEWEIID